MYAVIETGGKQYRVEVGTELEVELLDAEPGKTVKLDRVLLVADGDDASIGQPVVDGAAVSAEVVRLDRGPKLISFKYRPKARTRVTKGHRQELTILRISDITLNGKSAAKSAAKAESDAKTERQRLEEGAAAQAAKDAELAAKLAKPAAAAGEPATKSTAKSTKSTGKSAKADAAEEKSEPKAKGKAEAAKADPKSEAKADTAKADPKSEAKADTAKAETATAETAKADTKAPRKTTTKAKAADPDTDEAKPRKSAAKRATKKDE